ncbi:hypothetical protein [Absidia glauca]|uniref:Brl1/Brr6 domain-containing protein n=1 Tax=Absidia glauca TaxID=4829 RepID=A0A168P2A0_ABSGL|nr:hypothetical protein [Absidia glauca]
MHASSNKSDSTVIGKKRSLTDIDSGAKVPSKANFDFTPTPLPHQNIFSIDTHPSTWSASSLNYRYQQQLKAKRQANKQRSSSPQSEQTTLYASKQWPTRPSSQPTSMSAVSSPIPAWTNYIYHRSLSSTIIGYIQLICNVVILSTIGYILFQLIFTLQQDFQIKADEYTNGNPKLCASIQNQHVSSRNQGACP